MSFATMDDVMSLTEQLVKTVWLQVTKTTLSESFLRMTYHEALATYGSDKPDLRYPFKLTHLLTRTNSITEALIFSTNDPIQDTQFPLCEFSKNDWISLRTLLAPISSSVAPARFFNILDLCPWRF